MILKNNNADQSSKKYKSIFRADDILGVCFVIAMVHMCYEIEKMTFLSRQCEMQWNFNIYHDQCDYKK